MTRRHILRVDASARREGSVSRELAAGLAAGRAGPDGEITVRDLAQTPVAQIDEAWVAANFTSPEDRTPDQISALAESGALVAELQDADEIVIGVPVYNFSIPAALKAWIDQIARARLTFRYTEAGPEGLLTGKTAWLVVASGGTPVGSEIDFATPYLKHMLGFVGITDVRLIDAARWGSLSQAEQAAVRASVEGVGRKAA